MVSTLQVVKLHKEKTTDNLIVRGIITNTTYVLKDIEVEIIHCYEQANQVANFMANLASTSGNSSLFYSFQHLPPRAIVVLRDHMGVSGSRRGNEVGNRDCMGFSAIT
ncbi:hypothetical protein HAX54_028139 [Datura stramonium]|uniref:RNase H type-1 domain-containing protein n=1 Tax=Datura stramonium TaxID=4076 RepID=A0ABS8S9E7_DATST|nr:hypothetical protein [Datura stramonium]